MDFLERSLLDSADRECRRIGQELHDHLCQHLLGAAFAAKALANNLPAGSPESVDASNVARLVNSAVQQARDVARGLNPVDLNAAGLIDALRDLTKRPKCRLESGELVVLPSADSARHAYRIAQEAVTNAIKHSGADEILVRVVESDKGLQLEIIDNGIGFERGPHVPKSMGLETMRIRAEALGGYLSIDTPKGGGTRVICMLPKRI